MCNAILWLIRKLLKKAHNFTGNCVYYRLVHFMFCPIDIICKGIWKTFPIIPKDWSPDNQKLWEPKCYLYNYLRPYLMLNRRPHPEKLQLRVNKTNFKFLLTGSSPCRRQTIKSLKTCYHWGKKNRWTWPPWPLFSVPLSQLEKFPLLGLGN